MRRRPGLRPLLATALSFALAASADAQFTITNNTGTATAKTTYGPGSFLQPQTVISTFGPNGGAAVADLPLQPFGRIRGVQTGYGLNAVHVQAVVGDIPFFDWAANTKYQVDVQGGPFSSSLDFQYHLNGGRLALYDPVESFDGMLATVGVSIFTISPGFSGFLWSWVLSLRGFQGAVTPTVDFLIDPLGFGTPALSAVTIGNGAATLDIGAFTASVNLGLLSHGGTAHITYDMDAGVSGFGFNATGGLAALGDPFDASGNYGAGITLTAVPAGVAPEPSALLFVATGLGGLGGIRWSRSRRRAVCRA